MTLTQRIVDYALSIDKNSIAPEVEKAATEIMRDCIGCMLGGMNDWPVRAAVERFRGYTAKANASVIGKDRPVIAPECAAMVNAMAAHIRDFDDICMAAEAHPTVAVLPVVLAVGEALGASGREIVNAYIAGVEVTGLLGSSLFTAGYHMGWDATCTMGVFGTTAAAAKLLKLPKKKFVYALGIAATEAGGLRASYGTFAKDLTAGRTAEKGIYAAEMALAGFDASPAALEDESGLLAVSSNGIDMETFDRIVSGRVSTFLSPGMVMKRYPSCRGTHNATDAALSIAREPAFDAAAVREVVCRAEHSAIENDRYPDPKTPIEGKFSIPYCVALALQNGAVRLEDFAGEKIEDAKVHRLCRKVRVLEQNEGFTRGKGGAEVVAVMEDGTRYARSVDIAKGDPRRRLTEGELRCKFMDIAQAVMRREDAEDLYRFLGGITGIADAGEIVRRINRKLVCPE